MNVTLVVVSWIAVVLLAVSACALAGIAFKRAWFD